VILSVREVSAKERPGGRPTWSRFGFRATGLRRGSDGVGGRDPVRPDKVIRQSLSDGTGTADFPGIYTLATRASAFTTTAKGHESLPEGPLRAGTLALSSANVLGLSLIHASPEPIVDFIFVHGFGGTATGTWSWQRDPKNFWPVWLASDPELMESRIFTFGYNADWFGQSTQSTILDFAKDLLVRVKTYSSGLDRSEQLIGMVFIHVQHTCSCRLTGLIPYYIYYAFNGRTCCQEGRFLLLFRTKSAAKLSGLHHREGR
jgi:hypothetical protein